MPLGSPPIRPSTPLPLFCAGCGCEVDPAAWNCANCGSSLHLPGATKSTSSYTPETWMNPRPAHGKARRVFRFFLYLGSLGLFIALTWGQDLPGEDPKTSLIWHAIFIGIVLMCVIDAAVNLHLYNSLTTSSSMQEQSVGEEIFEVGLIAVFWGLYYGLKWQLLPAEVYTRHLEGSLRVVFCAILLIILWSAGIFSRR
jgi:hypothetical protein